MNFRKPLKKTAATAAAAAPAAARGPVIPKGWLTNLQRPNSSRVGHVGSRVRPALTSTGFMKPSTHAGCFRKGTRGLMWPKCHFQNLHIFTFIFVHIITCISVGISYGIYQFKFFLSHIYIYIWYAYLSYLSCFHHLLQFLSTQTRMPQLPLCYLANKMSFFLPRIWRWYCWWKNSG